MQLNPYIMNVNGTRVTVMAPSRKDAIKIAEKDFRLANNLAANVQVTAMVVGQFKPVSVTAGGLVGVR